MAVDADILRQVPFLAPLKDKDLRRLASHMSERRVAAGEEIVAQGGDAIAFFVLLEGEAQVYVDGTERRTLGAGAHFGEIALVLSDARRTATVRAKTDVRLGALATWNFRGFVAEHPEVAWPLLEELARRVRDTPGA